MSPEQLLELGFSVIPCYSGTGTNRDKTPCIKWKKFQDRLPTLQEIANWKKRFPGCNWAIVTGEISKIVVLDIDSAEGAEYADCHGLPISVSSRTQDGTHVILKHPGVKLSNWTKRIPGCDFRGDGGYIMAPGSTHPSGNVYAFMEGYAPSEATIADMPQWLLDACLQPDTGPNDPHGDRASAPEEIEETTDAPTSDLSPVVDSVARVDRYAQAAFDAEIEKLRTTAGGQRNMQLFKSAASLFEFVAAGLLNASDVENTLRMTARNFPLDPERGRLSEHEITATIESGRTHGNKPRTIPAPRVRRQMVHNGVVSLLPDESQESEREARERLTFANTDVGNGERFAHQHNGQVLFDHSQKRFLLYDDTRYRPDDRSEVFEMAEALTWDMLHGSNSKDDASWATRSMQRERLRAMLEGAKSKPNIAVVNDELDSNPWLFNCMNGTLNLRNGIAFRDHEAGDRMTKLAPVDYDPEAIAPLFLSVLHRIMPDESTRTYLQTRLARALTADMSLQEFYICYGLGANGKSTILEQVFLSMFGDYAAAAMAHTFQTRQHDQGPRADLVDLIGKRFALTGESNEGRNLDEAMIKAITGGDRIKARRPHSPNDIEFAPTWKTFMMTNHKPEIAGTELAIWRRVKVIPFEVTIPEAEQDRKIGERLQYEFNGILNWLLDGLRLFYGDRVTEPETVKLAVAQYRADSDSIGNFIDDCFDIGGGKWATIKQIQDAYEHWCKDNREEMIGPQKLTKKLVERGFEKGTNRTKTIRLMKGFSIRGQGENPAIDSEEMSF